MSEELDFNRSV